MAAGLLDGTGEGVWFADLAPLRDPDLVATTVADVLSVRQEPGRPVVDTLVDAVGGRPLLVLLDNCEHVIGACAKLADALLRGCPDLALLATSREPLGIGGEFVYRVPSLGVPAEGEDAAAVRASEAVRLLADRAAAQGVPLAQDEQTAAVAGRICRRLDGIPLAIELAAARLRVLPAGELEARLDERFALLTGGLRVALPRQRTLRAMVDWSWELLTGAERAVLAALSVFAGGFGLSAAEAVAAGPDVPAAEVAGLLSALVDKSLVQFDDAGTGPGRYRLLETVRQYAAGQLDALGKAAAGAARIGHRDYYLALAEAAAPQLMTADQAEWLDRLDAELGNLRAAHHLQSGPSLTRYPACGWPPRCGCTGGPGGTPPREPVCSGRSWTHRPSRRRRWPVPGRWPPRPPSSRPPAATRPPRTIARKPWLLPAPTAMTTWSPTCCMSVPRCCCARGSPAHCRSSRRALAWPAASGSLT